MWRRLGAARGTGRQMCDYGRAAEAEWTAPSLQKPIHSLAGGKALGRKVLLEDGPRRVADALGVPVVGRQLETQQLAERLAVGIL